MGRAQGRAWRPLVVGAVVLAALGAGACSDDDDAQAEEDVVTDDEYAAEVERLCEQHAAELEDEAVDMVADGASDADVVSFLRVERIPRTRAVMEGLVAFGLPPARAAEIVTAFNEVNSELNRLNGDTYGYIDRTRDGDPTNAGTLETFNAYVAERLDVAGVPCLQA
jgi:hypothetical protein